MVALAERPCTPCRGGVYPLTPSECASCLAEVPDWGSATRAGLLRGAFVSPLSHGAGIYQRRERSGGGNLASTGASVGLGLREVSLTTRKDRRPARVGFRDGGSHRRAGCRSSRSRLAATSARAQMGSRKCKGVDHSRSQPEAVEDHGGTLTPFDT